MICKSCQLHFQNISRRKLLLPPPPHHQPGLSLFYLQPHCHRGPLTTTFASYRDSLPSSQQDLIRGKLDHITAWLKALHRAHLPQKKVKVLTVALGDPRSVPPPLPLWPCCAHAPSLTLVQPPWSPCAPRTAHSSLGTFALADLHLAYFPLRSQSSSLAHLLQDFALMSPLWGLPQPPYSTLHIHLCVPILLFSFACFWPGHFLTSKNTRISLTVFTICLPS